MRWEEANGYMNAHVPGGWFSYRKHLDHWMLTHQIGDERNRKRHYLMNPEMCEVVAEHIWQEFVTEVLMYEGETLHGGTD